MLRYVAHRLLHSLFVIWAITLLIFLLVNLLGNPVYLMLPPDASQESVDQLTREMGLDRPLPERYLKFLGNAVRGDLGQSLRHRESAFPLALSYVPATFQLAATSFLFSVLIAVPLGIISATRRNSVVDQVVRVFSLIGQAMPNFWFAMILIQLFSVELRWLPASGRGSTAQLILPAVALGYSAAAATTRLLRSAMLEVLQTDYVRTARAKGLAEWRVVLKHVLRNASFPVITIMGLELGRLLGGAIATESIFAWPGLGQFLIHGVANLDFPAVQSSVLIIAVTMALINLMTDLSYGMLDPRVQYQ